MSYFSYYIQSQDTVGTFCTGYVTKIMVNPKNKSPKQHGTELSDNQQRPNTEITYSTLHNIQPVRILKKKIV